ncbi:XRE family transcriptional regulator [Clostridium sp. chh4-2]|uniref:helix-turn-helix domain-containing protein n=1 Tax=Clostridium sp. chh4-2 TaxID=2067550 RepID=UPI000CCF3D8E|nr:helix-turn-helix transcriptional regulator [Clostridium sp. chh4-2]PNV60803.1 XRE family transcriptional regulator [Clostridium sp. chh4-2]
MNYIDLGRRIREERQKLNLTQEKLSESINVSTTYIGQIERGERCPTLDTLIRISNSLGVSIDYLLRESVTPSSTALMNLWIQLTRDLSDNEMKMIIELVNVIKNHKA